MLIDPPVSIVIDSCNFPTIIIKATAEKCAEIHRFAHGIEWGLTS